MGIFTIGWASRSMRCYRATVRFAVAALVLLTLANPARTEYVDNRVDSIRAARRDVISAASNAGNLLLQHWAEQNLDLVNRIYQGATDQQNAFFGNLDKQRDGILKGIEASLSDISSITDDKTYQLKSIVTGVQDTLVRVSRASRYPFVISHSPTYVLPTKQQDDVLFSVMGSYLNNAEPELMIDRRPTPKAINFQEAALAFRIPRSLLPSPGTTIQPVFAELKAGDDRGIISRILKSLFNTPSTSQTYRLLFYIVPERVGHVRIVRYDEKASIKRTSRPYPDPAQPQNSDYFYGHVREDGSQDPTRRCAALTKEEAQAGWKFDAAQSTIIDQAGKNGWRTPPTTNATEDQLCSTFGLSASNGETGTIYYRIQAGLYLQVKTPTPTVLREEDLTWTRPVFADIPSDAKNVVIEVEYFDGVVKRYDNSGHGRYVRTTFRNNLVSVEAEVPDTNLSPPGRL
jgi:hypothetical protein